MKLKLIIAVMCCMLLAGNAAWAKVLIPMDATGQANHLKAYGVAFGVLKQGGTVDWLLNYKGGSFAMDENTHAEELCKQRGVSYLKIADKEYVKITKGIANANYNGAVVKLEKAPRIAVYTPTSKQPWDDAVTLALTYAEIPFDKIYVDEVLGGGLDKYDWLHLFHEDFTGQYGKFWAQFHDSAWYKNDKQLMESMAAKHGYKKVSKMQLAVVKKIRDFVGAGGNMFAMCTATETFDIALAAEKTDICDTPFDGDPIAPDAQSKLDFSKCFAFRDFTVSTNLREYARANIDNTPYRFVPENLDYFTIVSPSAKLDLVPVMLTQNHVKEIHGFMGQTTAFRQRVIKPNVMILGDRIQTEGNFVIHHDTVETKHALKDYEARYIHGEYGKGSWTFLGGHDPEAYAHRINDPATDLKNYPNSPGYRLILNNVFFPAVKRAYVPTVTVNATDKKEEEGNNQPVKNVTIQPGSSGSELVITAATGNITSVSLVNIAGKEVYTHTYNAAKVNVTMHYLDAGMYMVKVNGEYVGKVIKD